MMKFKTSDSLLKKGVIFLGPLPPPYMGPSLATEIILNSTLSEKFELIHLNTSDHRPLSNLGSIDFTNIYLSLKHYLQLIWLIIKHRPKIVYIPISQTTIGYLRDSVFIYLAKILGRKVVCHLRGGGFGNWYNSTNTIMKLFVGFTHRFVDCQIVLGKCLKGMFENLIDGDKIHIVPNGADFKVPVVAKKQHDKVNILFFANLIKTKGVLDVLYSLPQVYEKHKNITYIFAGKWLDRKTEEEFELFLNSQDDLPVKNIGSVTGDQKLKLFAESDIFVFPSYYPPEGHPWVIIEAMAAGLPIISTDQGAIKESVDDGINGFIVDKQSPKQIAEKIITLIESVDLIERMGKASKKMYLSNFTEEKMVQRMEMAFKSVL